MPVSKPRKVSNLMALPVLSALLERPMHPYEIATTLRERGKHFSVEMKWGSLYTVVRNLEKHGFIEAIGSTREGRRPERTIYAITDAGRDELRDWLRWLLAVPEPEYTRLEAALGDIGPLPPDEVQELLTQRLRILDAQITEAEAHLQGKLGKELPRLFLIEAEYKVALIKAEAEWIRTLLKEFDDESLEGLAGWREYHKTGQIPQSVAEWTGKERDTD
jgi:DNA-binding PadR family transcriptional regulator